MLCPVFHLAYPFRPVPPYQRDIRLLIHPDKVQPEEIGHEELSMEMKVDGEMKHISSFQAFVVALASRIGTGNLAGVATAISIGGPGAVFWMWMLALLGSASAFIESTLAQLYKRKGKTSFYGGPAYYMKYGLGKGWMGILFAVLMIITFGFAYNSVQSNTICLAWQKAFGIELPPWELPSLCSPCSSSSVASIE